MYNESSYAQAADHLAECLDILFRHLDAATSKQSVPIFMGATAGVRVLNMTKPEATTQLFDTVKRRFTELGNNASMVTIISGTKEGLYAWIAVNYAANLLESEQDRSYGIVEIGGRLGADCQGSRECHKVSCGYSGFLSQS